MAISAFARFAAASAAIARRSARSARSDSLSARALCARRSFKLAGATCLRAIEDGFSRLRVHQALLYKRRDPRPSLHWVV